MKCGKRNRMRARRRESGFTLIEILVAITLLTVILSIVYGAFTSVVFSTEDAREVSQAVRTRQFLSRNFSYNLAQATEGWSPGAAFRGQSTESDGDFVYKAPVIRYWFTGENGGGDFGPADSLSFIATAPLKGATGLPGAIKMVTYEVVDEAPDDESVDFYDTPPQTLLRVTETPISVGPMGIGGDQANPDAARENYARNAESLGIHPVTWDLPIRSFDILYFDGKDWQETWDSQKAGFLPWAVDVRVNLPTVDGDDFVDPEADPDFRLLLSIPAGLGMDDIPPDYRFERRETDGL